MRYALYAAGGLLSLALVGLGGLGVVFCTGARDRALQPLFWAIVFLGGIVLLYLIRKGGDTE